VAKPLTCITLALSLALCLNGCSRSRANLPLQTATLGGITGAGIGAATSGKVAATGFAGIIAGGIIGTAMSTRTAIRRGLVKRGVQLITLGDEVVMVIPSDILFKGVSSRLAPKDADTLPLILKYIKSYKERDVYIDAYTDNVASTYRNWNLSSKQAERILSYMWANGFDRKFVHAKGHAQYGTVATNFTPKGSEMNRRIEIYFRI
jgi:intracellular multiplication protein IcmN